MKCPLCDCEAFIKASRYVVEGDTSKDEETKLFAVQELECRNHNCVNNGHIVHTVKIPMTIG